MKKIAAVGTLIVLSLPAFAFAKETTESLKYSGWHCAGCASKLEKAVRGVDGVKTAIVTRDTITVTYDDEKTTHDKIKGAVASAGKFEVKEAATAPKAETK